MSENIGHATLLVNDYDEAIAFYTEVLGFSLVEDTKLTEDKRWVRVAPKGSNGFSLLLAKATGDAQRLLVGKQTGGRVAFFLFTDDFWASFNALKSRNVVFVGEPREESYATVVVFKDLYGNLWDLLQPRSGNPAG